MQERDAEEQVEGARIKFGLQPFFLCELLRELECGHERCCEINQREEDIHATIRGVQGRNPRPPTSHGERQQCSGHDHIIRELVYSKLKKELSHVGFVSMTVDQAAQFYNHKHGRQLCAVRDVVVCKNSEGVEERTSIYVIDRDLGNVAYSSWIKSVLDQGQTTNEESLGDVVEMILGFFEVMSYLQHELPIVERCMEDQEGVRAFHRAAPRGEREPHHGPKPKAEQVVRPARNAHKRGVGHHELDQAQASAIPGDRAGQPRVQEKGN